MRKLEDAARDAERKGENGRAVQLLRAAVQMAPQDVEGSLALADAWTLAFQFDEATTEYRRALTLGPTAEQQSIAQREIDRLTSAERPIEEDRATSLPLLAAEAREAFTLGETLRRSKDDIEATRAYEAALLLDDELPGPYRALGGEYERAGDTQHERQFFEKYLAMRETGPIAEDIRKRLAKIGALGTVDVQSALPCELWVNDQDTGRKTPSVMQLPEGRFKVTCDMTATFHSAFSTHDTLAAGETKNVKFDVGVLSVALDPWARVSVDGRDVGLYDKTAIQAGHHVIQFVAHDGSKQKRLEIDLAPGQTVTVSSW